MRYYVYETTNLINGKKYRGAHISKISEDGYLGSGKLLKRALNKYGIENFKKEILIECFTVEDMFYFEALFVDEDWVKDENTYNLKIGGEGGWDYINKQGCRWNEEKKRLHSIEMKKKIAIGEWGPKKPTRGFLGKTHSIEVRKKISENRRLDKDEITKRIEEWNSIEPHRGKITKVSKMWNLSHTQVKRFVHKYLGFA